MANLSFAAVQMLSLALGQPGPGARTADLPDSWLVLYNINDADSVSWSLWYANERQIPPENLLGLNASTNEHLPDAAAAEAQVLRPVRSFLAAHPDIAARTMGFVVGYRLPGHFGNAAWGIGGYSVACALQCPSDTTTRLNPDCARRLGDSLPPSGRLTRSTMAQGHYMVARIDGVDLGTAKALTRRAKAIRSARSVMPGQFVYYDYSDPVMPEGVWYGLQRAVQDLRLAWVPWRAYDEDTEQTPYDAFRFGTHDVRNWNDARLRGTPPGPRILGYDMNSWGATTVRSITAEGGRYVPNAIDAGYAAAIGSTGEPNTPTGPFPDTLLTGLRAGWTLGEVFYLSNPYDGFMWTLVGDPFLQVPDWSAPLPCAADFDRDGDVDAADFFAFAACYGGEATPLRPGCEAMDLDHDQDVDLSDYYTRFTACFNGANRPPASTCLD